MFTQRELQMLLDFSSLATQHVANQIAQAGRSAAKEGAERIVEIDALADKIEAALKDASEA